MQGWPALKPVKAAMRDSRLWREKGPALVILQLSAVIADLSR